MPAHRVKMNHAVAKTVMEYNALPYQKKAPEKGMVQPEYIVFPDAKASDKAKSKKTASKKTTPEQTTPPAKKSRSPPNYNTSPRKNSAGINDPLNVTQFLPDQMLWSWHNLPDILYQLKPTEKAPDKKARNQLPIKMSPLHDKMLVDFPILPDYIASNVEEFRVEAWLRLDRRIRLSDITDRMLDRCIIRRNSLQQRNVRFRQAFNLVAWDSTHPVTRNKEKLIRGKLWALGLDPNGNSTRGLTPGLINPALGEEGGRIPIPTKYMESRGKYDIIQEFGNDNPIFEPLAVAPTADALAPVSEPQTSNVQKKAKKSATTQHVPGNDIVFEPLAPTVQAPAQAMNVSGNNLNGFGFARVWPTAQAMNVPAINFNAFKYAPVYPTSHMNAPSNNLDSFNFAPVWPTAQAMNVSGNNLNGTNPNGFGFAPVWPTAQAFNVSGNNLNGVNGFKPVSPIAQTMNAPGNNFNHFNFAPVSPTAQAFNVPDTNFNDIGYDPAWTTAHDFTSYGRALRHIST